MTDVLINVGIAAVILLLVALAAYNGLAQLRQQVRTAWGEMDAALKQRYDQLPDFLNTLKMSPDLPAAAVGDVTAAKHRAAVAFNPAQLAAAENELTAAISSIGRMASKDPLLADDARFIAAFGQVRLAQNRIARKADEYNQHVDAFNQSLRSFPHAYAARIFGFAPQPTFDPADELKN